MTGIIHTLHKVRAVINQSIQALKRVRFMVLFFYLLIRARHNGVDTTKIAKVRTGMQGLGLFDLQEEVFKFLHIKEKL